uniref:Uncharacterized protein n=2 Tax=Oryza sativa subsp. japonica TaxID=39947 RepID=Q7G3S2_ORYSJ|nr:Hypothetical protein [Oryza sativa Japonica Group]AAP53064.1 hypothetical protein LOC_Os10g18810 [Oryza sativa Japonica Group]
MARRWRGLRRRRPTGGAGEAARTGDRRDATRGGPGGPGERGGSARPGGRRRRPPARQRAWETEEGCKEGEEGLTKDAATEGAAAEGGGGAPRGEDDGGDSAVSNEGGGAAGVRGSAANAVEAVAWLGGG